MRRWHSRQHPWRGAPPDLRALLEAVFQHVDDEAAAFRKKLNHDIGLLSVKREQVVNVKATHTGDRLEAHREGREASCKSEAPLTTLNAKSAKTNKKKWIRGCCCKKPAGKLDAEASAKQKLKKLPCIGSHRSSRRGATQGRGS